MAYRRRQGTTRSSTFKEEIYHQHNHHNHHNDDNNQNDGYGIGSENGSLAARAMKASAAHRDSAAYGYAYVADSSSSPSSSSSYSPAAVAAASTSSPCADFLSPKDSDSAFSPFSRSKGSFFSESTSTKDANDSKYGFWGILAQKAKSILEEDGLSDSSSRTKPQANDANSRTQSYQSSHPSSGGGSKLDNVKLRKRLDAITSSLNNLGDTMGKAFEEGRTIVETKTADIIQETRKLQIRRRGGNSDAQDQATVVHNTSFQRPMVQSTLSTNNQGTQLKASRDVAMATAAKAKVLLRELKTVKAELAFAKERCAQLEEENKRLRESRETGDNPADDDLIRLQLESLLAEKARLAHENAIHARENRFLREIVEYHRLTMQDIVYLDENGEEVTEDNPFSMEDSKWLSNTPNSPISPMFYQDVSSLYFPTQMKEQTGESPKEEAINMACSSTSSPYKPSPLGYQPESVETTVVTTTLQVVSEEKKEDSSSKKPLEPEEEDVKRPLES